MTSIKGNTSLSSRMSDHRRLSLLLSLLIAAAILSSLPLSSPFPPSLLPSPVHAASVSAAVPSGTVPASHADACHHFQAALAHEDAGDPAAALPAYDLVIAIDAGYLDAWLNRGHVLIVLGEYRRAIDSYDRVLILAGAWPDAGEGEETAAPLISSEAIQPAAAAWYGRGIASARLDRIEEAVESFRQATVTDPTSAAAWDALGDALLKTGRSAESQEAYRRAIALDHTIAAGTSDLWLSATDPAPLYRADELRVPVATGMLFSLLPAGMQAPSGAWAVVVALGVLMVRMHSLKRKEG